MEMLVMVLVLLIVVNSAFKMSLWPWWQRGLFSLLLGAFIVWGMDIAAGQSKTEVSAWLRREDIRQWMAIIITLESSLGVMFCLSYFDTGRKGRKSAILRRMLYVYPPLLLFPVVFYLSMQCLFVWVGSDFTTTAWILAMGAAVLVPLLTVAAGWLLPDRESRVEAHLWLTAMVCVIGLLMTQNGKIIYNPGEHPVDWTAMALTLSGCAVAVAAGFLAHRVKWKIKRNKWN